MTRRRFLVAGAGGTLAVIASALYAPFLVGERFETFVAERLGIGVRLARPLLARAREQYGDAEYDARAAVFALAFRRPLAMLVPAAVKRPAAEALVGPMVDTPAAALAYVESGRSPDYSGCRVLRPLP